MEGNMPRGRTPNSLQYLATEASAQYIKDYCHFAILNYESHHGLGDAGREVRNLFNHMKKYGIELHQREEFLNQCAKLRFQGPYFIKAEMMAAVTYGTPRQSFEEFVEYLRKLKTFWEDSLGYKNNFLRKQVNQSLLRRMGHRCLSTLPSFIIGLLFFHEIPEFENHRLQFSREEDCQHLGKILNELTPFNTKNFDSRWLEFFNGEQPLKNILMNSDLQKLTISGTEHFSNIRLHIMSMTNLTELGLDMRQICIGPEKFDAFSFLFQNKSFEEVVTQLANGRECNVTFPNLERLFLVSRLNQNTRYLFYCLLFKYDKLKTNIWHCGPEKMYTKNVIIFSKVGEDEEHQRCSREYFPPKIQQNCGLEFIHYNISEEGTIS